MPHHPNHHHHPAHEARNADVGVATEVSVVYVTASPTFAGPIATYITPSMSHATGAPNFFDGGSSASVQSAPLAAGGQKSSNLAIQASSLPSSSPIIMAPSSSASALPSNIQSAASSSMPAPQQTTLASSATSAIPTNANAQGAPTAAPSAPASKHSGGMSAGAQAGLAIGMILLVAILAGIGFLFYRKKKSMDAQGHRLDDEKSNTPAPLNRAPSVAMPNPTAPRLSLRPSTDAMPQMNEKHAALGGVAPVAAPTTRGRTPEPQNDADKSNPFGDDAKLPDTVDPALAPKPLNVSRPGTPTQGEKSAPAPVAATGPAPGSPGAAAAAAKNGPNGALNVHRVQLDFAPSMEDELELRQGQLVRMLHEYDDGWCLCVRLDRSQQGVCPRSCISKLPVKPRPPPGQRPKGPAPGSPRSRSNSNAPSANGSRPGTPKEGPFGEGQYRTHPKGVEEQRKQSPTYEASLLSNSPNQSPPSSPESNQAPIARKPNPGRAA